MAQGHWYDFLGLAALVLTPVAVMMRVLEDAKRIPVYKLAGYLVDARWWPPSASSCS